jgi:hypothetical protein
MLKIITARNKSDVAGLQEKFRETVDKFLKDLPAAEAPERQLIRDSFKREVVQDLGALKKDLALAGLDTPGGGTPVFRIGELRGSRPVCVDRRFSLQVDQCNAVNAATG